MPHGISRRAVAALAAAGAAGVPVAAGALAPFTWDRRVLLAFAAVEGPALQQQRDLLAAARPEFEERDMVVLAVIGGDRVEALLGSAKGASAAALRERFGVPATEAFAAVLVGKDGGEKWRAARPAEPGELFALIDTMPMRRNEMQRSG
jgi:hypothetical protein